MFIYQQNKINYKQEQVFATSTEGERPLSTFVFHMLVVVSVCFRTQTTHSLINIISRLYICHVLRNIFLQKFQFNIKNDKSL